MESRVAPNYHRQRFVLFLLEQVGSISVVDFQKLLFLSNKELSLNYYDSVRYKNRFHSFQAIADLEILEEKDWIITSENIIQLKDRPFLGVGAKKEERWLISCWIRKYENLFGDDLVLAINEAYPENTQNAWGSNNELFTIGYEGLSLEAYLTKLIQHNINVLYDLRKNPLSRKFGFSKGTLAGTLPLFGIEYKHIPELGIVSQKRQNLNTESDYIQLFNEYRESLPGKKKYLQELIVTFDQGKRIALTCFEEKPKSCHRHCVSDYLSDQLLVSVVHL